MTLIKSVVPSSTSHSHDVMKIAGSVVILKHMAGNRLTQEVTGLQLKHSGEGKTKAYSSYIEWLQWGRLISKSSKCPLFLYIVNHPSVSLHLMLWYYFMKSWPSPGSKNKFWRRKNPFLKQTGPRFHVLPPPQGWSTEGSLKNFTDVLNQHRRLYRDAF